MPADRLRSEIFNAGRGWRSQFEAPAIIAMVEALVTAYSTMPQLLRASDRPAAVVSAVAHEATVRAFAEAAPGEHAAVAIAERAMLQVLASTARAEGPLVDTDPAAAAAAWEQQRGRIPSDLVRSFLERVLDQFASHVISRDVPAAVGASVSDARAARDLVREVGRDAARTADQIDLGDLGGDVSGTWPRIVRQAFEAGRRLPAAGK